MGTGSPLFATRFLPCDLGDGVGAFGIITSRLSVRDADFRRDHPLLDGVDDPLSFHEGVFAVRHFLRMSWVGKLAQPHVKEMAVPARPFNRRQGE